MREASRRRMTVATAVGTLLVAGALGTPARSVAGYEKGAYAGNSTAAAYDEPLSFKVIDRKKKVKKATEKLRKAKKKLKRASKKAKAKKKVKRAKRKVGKAKKRRFAVKDFEMETVVLDCDELTGPGGPVVKRYIGAQAVPIGSVYEGKNAATVNKKRGSFTIEMRSNRHPDEGQHVMFKGSLSDDAAEGRFLVDYDSYFADCTSHLRFWEASPTG